MSERLPEELELVLITDGEDVIVSFRMRYYEPTEFYGMWNVTHWMPLPEPPKEAQDAKDVH